MDLINRLTEKIDSYASENVKWIGTNIHANMWSDLDNLRNHRDKENLMMEWKYKDAFESTVNSHLNENKIFELMSWEQSFAVSILFMHYH